MKLKDLPDDFTIQQFKMLDKESLDAVPYTRRKWLCQFKGCCNGTHIRDYGLGGELNRRGIWAFLDRNSKYAAKHPDQYWMGPNNYWLCGKHHKLYDRLLKRFDIEHIWRKLLDTEKEVIVDVVAKGKKATGSQLVERIE